MNVRMPDLTPRGAPERPEAPRAPGPEDCCHSGCTWCVLDLYQEELEKYRKDLAEWEALYGKPEPAPKPPRKR